MKKKVNLLNMTLEELSNFLSILGEYSFRSNQIMHWIYYRYCNDFSQMTNLSKSLRLKLNQIAEIKAPSIVCDTRSIDETIKWIMKVDHQYIETVYIPDIMRRRATLCISSQAGCALKCSFCGTGQKGFYRNLKISEIVGQIWKITRFIFFHNKYNKKNKYIVPITHIVFMGMGEPLLNIMNVVASIKIILSNFGFNLSKHHVTVSTSGIVPGIDKLKNMVDVSLAISLHASNDIVRNKIMPINQKYNIDCLIGAIHRYSQYTTANRGKVTIEYVMLNGVNDELEYAHELAKKLIQIPCKVNLIPWNPILYTQYTTSTSERISAFYKVLKDYGIVTTIRETRGLDINAACGQLTGEVIPSTRCDKM